MSPLSKDDIDSQVNHQEPRAYSSTPQTQSQDHMIQGQPLLQSQMIDRASTMYRFQEDRNIQNSVATSSYEMEYPIITEQQFNNWPDQTLQISAQLNTVSQNNSNASTINYSFAAPTSSISMPFHDTQNNNSYTTNYRSLSISTTGTDMSYSNSHNSSGRPSNATAGSFDSHSAQLSNLEEVSDNAEDIDDEHISSFTSSSKPSLGGLAPSQKSISNSNKYKRFRENITEGVQDTIDKGLQLSDLFKFYKINSKSTLKERENFKSIFSIRCLMEIAYASDTNEKGTEVLRSSLYLIYHNLCESLKVEPIGPSSIGKLIRIAFPQIKTKRLGIRGQSKYHYIGIKLKEKYLRLAEKLDNRDSNLMLTKILISNFNVPVRHISKRDLTFSDYLVFSSDNGNQEAIGLFQLNMNYDTSKLFQLFSRYLLEGDCGRSIDYMFSVSATQSSKLPKTSLLNMILYNNFISSMSIITQCAIDIDLRSKLRNIAKNYHSLMTRKMRQLARSDDGSDSNTLNEVEDVGASSQNIGYRKNMKSSLSFVKSIQALLDINDFSPGLDRILSEQSGILFQEFNMVDFGSIIREVIDLSITELIDTNELNLQSNVDSKDIQGLSQRVQLLLSDTVSEFSKLLKTVTTYDETSESKLEATTPKFPAFQKLTQLDTLSHTIQLNHFINKLYFSFKDTKLVHLEATIKKLADHFLKHLIRIGKVDHLQYWLVLKNWVCDCILFCNESIHLRVMYFEEQFENERNEADEYD
ncbi:hypothetical protein CANARDRAFT_26639 [[Candida] arabinofermentans NRRL YB-2248]|uniref:RFX-type winged-helix domain-containing protein n=1 Tax=[Candida] arabinofermentans NRRL YB-2248 TaxID=983967 RepID=A0A1E4T6B8_9ASCO|nr:hypothetical protein CANARDRAFT_26639 [[Candida] arabinofermentans NRRL YB-2248]